MESVTRSPIYSSFSEALAGSVTIRAYGHESRFMEKCQITVDNNQRRLPTLKCH
ncbi:hypothetical protein HDU92_006828, partial [Lobulomyces angularis]